MPVLHPAEIWQQSGRWDDIKAEMFRLKDRHGRDMCLGMTHEEVIAWLASREIRSYRELPQIWYQIQTKERDEARPRSGVLRTREFLMKDAYTLDPDEAALAVAYDRQKEAYVPDLRAVRARVPRRAVRHRDDGRPGRARVHGAQRGRRGRDRALPGVRLRGQRRAGARSRPATPRFPARRARRCATPGARTIAEVCALLKSIRPLTIKSPALRGSVGPGAGAGPRRPRAPREKLARAPGRGVARGAPRRGTRRARRAGRLGGPGRGAGAGRRRRDARRGRLRGAAPTARACTSAASGPGRDFTARYADLHVAQAGDGCPQCGEPLVVERVIEIGNIFKLGTKYSTALGRDVPRRAGPGAADRDGVLRHRPGAHRRRRRRAASRRRRHRVALVDRPGQVHVLPVNVKQGDDARDGGAPVPAISAPPGCEALLDDRDERPGVKFKDADLLGLPIRVTVGAPSPRRAWSSFGRGGTARTSRSRRTAWSRRSEDLGRRLAADL